MLTDIFTPLILAGLALIIAGFILLFIQQSGSNVKGGAILMIGPIPVIAGNDRRLLVVLMVLAITLMLIWVFAQL
ncbi:MAG: DUF131 domain-containing protein [Conexivisphaerales archaeon]